MRGLLNWTGNLLFFLLFLTVTENLLPGKKYNRYIRLFAGMVLILLVAEPLTGGLGLEERMAYYFEAINVQQDVRDLSKEILGIEEQRLDQVIAHYEQEVETDLGVMAEELGYVPVWTQVTIEKDRASRAYGTVVHIEMKVEPWDRQTEKGEEPVIQAVSPVEPVAVSLQDREPESGTGQTVSQPEPGQSAGGMAGQPGPSESSGPASQPGSSESVRSAGQPGLSESSGPASQSGPAENGQRPGQQSSGYGQVQKEPDGSRLNQLRRKVERYYGLETREVEIEFQGK